MDAGRYERAHHSVYNPLVTLIGQTAYAAVLLVIYLLYVDVTPAPQMRLWLMMVALVLGMVALFDLAFAIRRPDPAEMMRLWRPVDKCIPAAFDLLAVGVLLLLFPHAGPDLRALSVAFFIGYVPLQMISDPENARGNQFSIVSVLGAFALSLVLHGERVDLALALLSVIYGAVLFVASDILRKGVITAIAERQISDQRAADLQQAMVELRAERDAKTRFIATAAHDLSQPVVAARLFAGQLGPSGPALTGLRAALDSINTMLADMLNSLRLQADAVRPHPDGFAAQSMLESLRSTYAAMAAEAGIALRILPSRRTLVADRALLERALGNLLVNALQHSQGSRVVLGLRAAPPGRLRAEVWDDGVDIDPADAPRLFEDYFQTDTSRLRGTGSFGLGLASVRRLARLLGGEVSLRPRGGRGVVGAGFRIEIATAGTALPVEQGGGG